MQIIKSSDVVEDKVNLGGKAQNLFDMLALGINVPEFIVIPADVTRKFASPDNTMQIPEALLLDVYENLPESEFYAVRSSALNEDGLQASFAGQFETLLYQTRDTLKEAIKKVIQSVYSERVSVYSKTYTNQSIAIIIQSMVNAEKAGVAFGINPLSGNKEEKVINALFGQGEALVSGELDADMYVVSTEYILPTIVAKEWKMVFDNDKGHGLKKTNLDIEKSEVSTLNEEEINAVCKILDKLNHLFGHPQDIEFAFENNHLILLQTRPITVINQKEKPEYGFVTIWDNSNIIESYPGITSPLTFSFISKMYEAVYTQLSSILGVSDSKIRANKNVFANMLGHLWGRVYYNLNHWHQTLSLLPGYSLNAEFMDGMMGVKEKFDTTQIEKGSAIKEWGNVFRAIVKILYAHSRINKDRKAFLKYFNSVMRHFQSMDFEQMDALSLMKNYLEFEETLVKKWKAPLVNDFFCMIYFGLLQKLVVKYELDNNGTLHNDLVSGAKDIITTEPITLTLEIVKLVKDNPKAMELFQSESPEKIYEQLKQPEFTLIYTALNSYIGKWGERCVGELKLETQTYKQEPANYVKIIKSYVISQTPLHHGSGSQTDVRNEAEKIANKKLGNKFLKRKIFGYVLRKARYLVSNRENLRFERTRGFGMVRVMMVAMGKKLSASGIIEQSKDIFFLEQNEIFNYLKGTSPDVDLKGLIRFRKEEFERFEKPELPERIRSNGPVYLENIIKETASHDENTLLLKGIGCCAGIVKGVAVVVMSPHEIESINGGILITASTDPGWVVLFPSASAIVVERGSLLSHSAIVSREMGIPCIVGVKGLLSTVKTGDIIEMNGSTGEVKIIERNV